METPLCFEIAIPDLKVKKLVPENTDRSDKNHAHLYVRDHEIEMRILYESRTRLSSVINHWLSNLNWTEFGSYLSVSGEIQNDRVQKIELAEAQLLQVTTGSNQHEGRLEYISLFIDRVKIYWEPRDESINTAEFYLNDPGFHVVEDYYFPLISDETKFEIGRRKGKDDYYQIENAIFRPEFNFLTADSIKSSEAKIIKEPKIQFSFANETSETELLRYAETVRLLASFFYNQDVDYIFSRIHMKEHIITIKKIQNSKKTDRAGNLWAFRYYFDFDYFMKSNWKESAKTNYKKIKKAIEMFLQSISVDSTSRFLIGYNIIEICMAGTKNSNEKFANILPEKDVIKKYEEALIVLLTTISVNDHAEFRKKWETIPAKLSYKPMKSPLLQFLEDQGLDPENFPISVQSLKEIRDNITHGSLNKVSTKDLHRANILLHRISGILILNLLGIKEWNLNTDIPS
jgi:hypothetical protein